MKKLPKLVAGTIIILTLFLACGKTPALAEDINSIGIATYLPVHGKIANGDIISTTSKGYFLSSQEYDPQVVGVVSSKPAIALKIQGQKNSTTPVVNVGQVAVKVSGLNGNIKRGDFITTSKKPGVGMKASRSGYIVGQSLEDESFDNKDEVKSIVINLNLHFLQFGSASTNSLWQIFALSQIAAYEQPINVFKYVVSALLLIIAFGVGFVIFSRAINTGIQALGRNPLAGRMIQLSILFNVVLVIIVITSAIGIVWLFLRV